MCVRKERTRREKRMAEKKARKIWRRVSLLGALGTRVALSSPQNGRDPACGVGMSAQGLFLPYSFPPCPCASPPEAADGSDPCLARWFCLQVGIARKSVGKPRHTPCPWSLSNVQFRVLSGWCLSWDPWCSFYGSGLRVLSLSASPAPVGSPCPPT